MGIIQRLSFIFQSKMNHIFGSAQAPEEKLNDAASELRDELSTIKTALSRVNRQKKRQEVRVSQLESDIEEYNRQAKQAVKNGQDDVARKALSRKYEKIRQLDTVYQTITELEDKQSRIESQKEKLKTSLQQVRTKKETLQARHTAAEANTNASEALTGLDEKNIGEAVSDMRMEIEKLEARKDASDEL